MKIKIINKELPNFEKDFKVKNMNYDMVVAINNNETIALDMHDVEIIPENKWEDVVANCTDILKIKLEREISPALYIALIDGVRSEINEEIKTIELFNDDFKINKRGTWEKRLAVVINQRVPLNIHIVGTKYGKEFSVNIKEVLLSEFLEDCAYDIKELKKEIEIKQKLIDRRKHILEEVLKNSVKESEITGRQLSSGI